MEQVLGYALPVFYIVLPLGIVAASEYSGIIRKIGPLISCYIAGILIGNSGILPSEGRALLEIISSAAAALALPFMLLPLDLRRARALPKSAILSMAFAFVAIVISTAAGFLIFAPRIPEAWKISGLLVGVYTGGTPNLAAIQAALRLDVNTYLAVHTADVIVSGLYFLLLISVGKTLLRRVLPAYSSRAGSEEKITALSLRTFRDMARSSRRRGVFEIGLTGILIMALGAAASLLVSEENSALTAILVISSLSIAVSFLPRSREWVHGFHIGEYIILVFCAAVGSMADLSTVFSAVPGVLLYLTFSLVLSITLHVVFCRIFSIDADTMMITSTAAVFSPPFVGVVALALGNRDVIVPGITAGLIGYAAGNFLGVSMAHLMRLLM